MQRFVQRRYGDASVLERTEAPIPAPKRGDVIVRLRATSVNAGDVRVMRGDPRLIRLFFGLRRPRSSVRGMDSVGTIHAVGDEVDAFQLGDVVVAEAPGGAFAEYVRIPADRCVPLPPEIIITLAAALPVAGGTALLALDRANVALGERVLVLGASGGVGHFAVQLAAARGAVVTAVARHDVATLAQQWGATHVLPRGANAAELTRTGTYDVVIDMSGDRPLREIRSLLADGGRAALVAGSGGPVLGPIPRLIRSMFLTGKRAKLIPITATASAERLGRLVQALAAGAITPHIAATYSFANTPSAVAALDSGAVVGKVVITLEPS